MAIWALFMLFASGEGVEATPWTRWTRPIGHIVASNSFCIYLGQISYSTYLIHIPLLTLTLGMAGSLGWHSQPVAILVGTGTIPLIFLASALLYRFVELPGIRYGRRIASNIKKAPEIGPIAVHPV